MYLYVHFTKGGLVSSEYFHTIDKLGFYVKKVILQKICDHKQNYDDVHSSKELEDYLNCLNATNIDDLRTLINRYEEWVRPIIGKSVLHEIQNHKIIRSTLQ